MEGRARAWRQVINDDNDKIIGERRRRIEKLESLLRSQVSQQQTENRAAQQEVADAEQAETTLKQTGISLAHEQHRDRVIANPQNIYAQRMSGG